MVNILATRKTRLQHVQTSLLIICALLTTPLCLQAQPGTWTQKASLPAQPRYMAMGFSVGGKAYLYGGIVGTSYQNDLWEYDTSSNTWSQKANLASSARVRAAVFTIGNKAYFACGYLGIPTNPYLNELWEYNQLTNSWAQKNSLPATARAGAVGFSIGGKGYFCTGNNNSATTVYMNDLWEYNPVTDTWAQKNSLPAVGRTYATAFVIGNKGYITTGQNTGSCVDTWEYNPFTDSWIRKVDFPYSAVTFAGSFAAAEKGYVYRDLMPDFLEYNVTTDKWSVLPQTPLANRRYTCGFNMGTKGNILTGQLTNGSVNTAEYWQFDPYANLRMIIQNVQLTEVCRGDSLQIRYKINGSTPVTFSIQICDTSGRFTNPTTLGSATRNPGTDSLKVRIPSSLLPARNYWIRFVSTSDTSNVSPPFDVNGLGPIGISGGYTSTFCPGDSVTIVATPFNASYTYKWMDSVGTINGANKYIYKTASAGKYRVVATTKGCWDTSAFCQVVLASVPKCGFTINNPAQCIHTNNFIFTDTSTIASGSMTRLWTIGTNGDTSTLPGPVRAFPDTGTYSIKLTTTSNFGCISSVTKTVSVYPQGASNFTVNDSTQCLRGNNFVFTNNSNVSSGSFTNAWSFGDTNTSAQNNPSNVYAAAGSYNVKLVTTTNNGCKDSLIKTVVVYTNPVAAFSTDSAQCFVGNNFVMSNSSSGSPVSYNWNLGNSTFSSATNPSVTYASAGTYNIRLIVTDANACVDTLVKSARVKANPAIPTFSALPDTIVCDNVPVVLKTSSVGTKDWKLNGSSTSSSGDSLVVNNAAGAYSLQVTNTDNCSASSGVVNLSFKPVPPKPVITISGTLLTSSAAIGNQWYNSSGLISGETGQTFTASGIGSYYTIVTVNGCASPPANAVSYPATGIGQIEFNNILVYPNPNSGTFTIQLHKPGSEKITVRLLDMSGKEILKQVFEPAAELQMEQSGLSNGVYVLQISTTTLQKNMQLVIAR